MHTGSIVTNYLLILISTFFVFLPSIVAFAKQHDKRWPILGVNLVLNTIGIGWIVAWILYFTWHPKTDIVVPSVPTDLVPVAIPSRYGLFLTVLMRLLFSGACLGAATYSMWLLGTGLWSWLFVGIAVASAFTIFIPSLDEVMKVVAVVAGILSLIVLALLLLAGTTSGSFNLSESNQVFAGLLAALSLMGLSALAWSIRSLDQDDVNS